MDPRPGETPGPLWWDTPARWPGVCGRQSEVCGRETGPRDSVPGARSRRSRGTRGTAPPEERTVAVRGTESCDGPDAPDKGWLRGAEDWELLISSSVQTQRPREQGRVRPESLPVKRTGGCHRKHLARWLESK